jgi:hypothetical protein
LPCLFPAQGREIIANLSKAAGLAQMIAAMRPDIDNIDEYVRNTTARAFSVVASALGIPALLPFLKAVCMSKKSWQVGGLANIAPLLQVTGWAFAMTTEENSLHTELSACISYHQPPSTCQSPTAT